MRSLIILGVLMVFGGVRSAAPKGRNRRESGSAETILVRVRTARMNAPDVHANEVTVSREGTTVILEGEARSGGN